MQPRSCLLLGLAALLFAGPAFALVLRTAEPPAALSVARLDRVEEVRKGLGLSPNYDQVRDLGGVKIAVLDYGFDGVDGRRAYLPTDAVVVEHYDADFVRQHALGDPAYSKGFEPGNAHGRLMAQLVWGATGSRPEGPKFYLLNANGPTMFRRAVRYAIEAKVDVLLFSAVFEGAGNYDGAGPLRGCIDEAVAANILWINAAGNFGGRVYNGPVRLRSDGFLQLIAEKGDRDGTALEFRNRLDENTVTVTLTWNDYRTTEDAGTTKDLDLIVEDATGQVLGRGDLKQIEQAAGGGNGKSLNPRERVVLPALGASEQPYRIRIQHKAGTFADSGSVRVLLQGSRTTLIPDPKWRELLPALELLDASRSGEIYPPADHPRVITVGDGSPESSIGPTADHRLKPDVVIPDSQALFTNGDASAGSSNAAAYFAAIAVTLKAVKPDLRTEHLLTYATGLRAANKPATPPREPIKGPPAGLREVAARTLTTYGYGPIVDRVQKAVGTTPVRLWLDAEGRVVLGVPQRPVDLGVLFPNHPFPNHPQLSGEYECYLSLQPGTRGNLQIMDSFRLRADSPHRTSEMKIPRMAPQLVEVRQIPPEPATPEEQTREALFNRQWKTPGPEGLTALVRPGR